MHAYDKEWPAYGLGGPTRHATGPPGVPALCTCPAPVRFAAVRPRCTGHKGYPTSAHVAAIAKHGACAIHRRTFAPLKARALPPPTDAELRRVEALGQSAAAKGSRQ